MRPPERLRFVDVSKAFGAARAVDGVDLVVPAGAFVTLLGASGCGKTTLLRIAAGFTTPDQGQVIIDGTDATSLPPTPGVPDQAFFPSAVLRAAGLHLLAGAGRMGLLVIEDRHAPRLGGPAAQAQAAAFLSGGAMELATPSARCINAPMRGRCAAAMAGSSTKSSSTPPAAASESPMR